MLQPADSYDAAYGGFRWRLPALIQETAKGAVETFSFARLKALRRTASPMPCATSAWGAAAAANKGGPP